MLRAATRPSSAMCRTCFTSSLRRSSVSCGIGSRMIWPSFDGVSPRSDSWMPRSMSFMMLLSNGVIVSSRGSGTEIVASWLTGILVP